MVLRRLGLGTCLRRVCAAKRTPRTLKRFVSTATETPTNTPSSSDPILGITSELDKLAPRIDIEPENINVLEGPRDFYKTLCAKISQAKYRVFLATLYIGKTEHDLIACLKDALQRNPNLQVSILTDYLRGTRETPHASCATLLADLKSDFPDRVDIRMYHTPNLTGLRKRLIPKRINEGWGLQHMKLYGVDDEIVLSGANLAEDYFTNRQDRYHVFSSAQVTNFFADVFERVCMLSFQLRTKDSAPGYELIWPERNHGPSPLIDSIGYVAATQSLFKTYNEIPKRSPLTMSRIRSPSTSIYPLLIIPRVTNTELPVIETLLDSTNVPRPTSYMFTAGYFNPHPVVTASLLSAASAKTGSPAQGTVVTASPWANGFYGSKGVSGMLPSAYTLLSRRFLHQVGKKAPGMVTLKEWRLGTVGRPHGWTYHAKGLWLDYSASNQTKQMVTIIGSSNFTVRSYSLDTEAGVVVVTRDEKLIEKLKAEQENLLQYTKTVTEKHLTGGERRVGIGVRMAMWFVKAVGGSL